MGDRPRAAFGAILLAIALTGPFSRSNAEAATKPASSTGSDAAAWAIDLWLQYSVAANVTYHTVDQIDLKLDIYAPRAATAAAPVPTLVFFHGGGWMGGDKVRSQLELLPFLQLGMAVVNVDYRTTLAPIPVEDCRCALRWIIRNAAKYKLDTTRIVLTGESAGSHLALVTGMLPSSAGLDGDCEGTEELNVAAIVNKFGVVDVNDMIEGQRQQEYAIRWLGDREDKDEIARRVSPIHYVRPGLPAILTIHGDADVIAPYSHAVRLHEALDRARVPNQLLTIRGGKHGDFTRDQQQQIFATIREFLKKQGIVKE